MRRKAPAILISAFMCFMLIACTTVDENEIPEITFT